MDNASRTSKVIIPAHATEEGEGIPILRHSPSESQLSLYDPFLLIDQLGPLHFAPGKAMGVPDHPHRGFETVTYLKQGDFEHRDSRGGFGRLEGEGVQWMTAGSGIIHSEMPSQKFRDQGGTLHLFQIWVNLARDNKMSEPRYQELKKDQLKWRSETAAGVETRNVIEGIEPKTPIQYLDVNAGPSATWSIQAPVGHNVLVYVYEGSLVTDTADAVSAGNLILYGVANDGISGGDRIQVKAGSTGVKFLFLSGKPLKEPVARFGPFVMNTRKELEQAFWDYHEGVLR